MKTILLARVSTEEQKEAGNSLPAQLARLQKHMAHHKLELWKEYSFDESAWKKDRDEFSKVLKLLKSSKEPVAICCDKIDRLIRNFTHDLADLEELRRQGKVVLHFPSDNIILHKDSPATDLFRFTMGVSLAKYYSDSISDNVKRAQEEILRSGKFPGKAYFGYHNVTLENGDKWIEPDSFQKEVVKTMFQLYASGGYSYDQVVKKVNKQYRLKLTKSKVYAILTNKFYVGIMTWANQEYPHNYKTFIDPEVFEKSESIRLGHGKKKFKYAGLKYQYRGIIKCSECGCLITPEKKKGKYVYYHCTDYHGQHKNKNESLIWLREKEITKQLAKLFESMVIPRPELEKVVRDLKLAHEDKSIAFRNVLTHYQTEYDKYENRIENMYEDKLDGSITSDYYEQKRKEYRDKQSEVLAKIKQLQRKDESFYLTTAYLVELASRGPQLFESSEPAEKRQILQIVLRNLRLEGEKLRYDLLFPFDVIVKYASRSEWLPRVDSNHEP